MTDQQIINLIVLSLTVGSGWAVIAYEGYARGRGWPVGRWLRGPFSLVQAVAYLAMIVGLALSVMVDGWLCFGMVVISSFVFVKTLYPLAKASSQVVALLGSIAGFFSSIFIVWL